MNGIAENFLPAALFAYLILFARIGGIMVMLPGIGEVYISARIRLALALLVTLLFYPLLQNILPPLPASAYGMFAVVVREAMIGLFIGTLTRMVLTSLEIAGMIIASQMGISAATLFNPVMATQGSLISVFLVLAGIKIMLITDSHFLFFYAMRDSYQLFPATGAIPYEAFSESMTHIINDSFRIAVQMSAPFLVLGMMFFIGMGLLSRLMPQMQIFFITVPLQIILGLLLLGMCMSTILLVYLDFMRESLAPLLGQ